MENGKMQKWKNNNEKMKIEENKREISEDL